MVDVYTHFRTNRQQHERQQINVGADDALVLFDLDEGRRKDPIEQHLLANAVQKHAKLNHAILAQQINAIAAPDLGLGGRVLGDGDSIGSTGPVISVGPDGRPILVQNRNIGYQPVIVTLPSGTQMAATAVVSADRRYVRIEARPSFTGVGDVTTFTFSGSADETNGGTGNGDGGTGN
jgi:hypothetical protein